MLGSSSQQCRVWEDPPATQLEWLEPGFARLVTNALPAGVLGRIQSEIRRACLNHWRNTKEEWISYKNIWTHLQHMCRDFLWFEPYVVHCAVANTNDMKIYITWQEHGAVQDIHYSCDARIYTMPNDGATPPWWQTQICNVANVAAPEEKVHPKNMQGHHGRRRGKMPQEATHENATLDGDRRWDIWQ